MRALVKGKQVSPLRVLLYGPEGCGKSTWAASAPSPIFLCSEEGTAQLDVTRFKTPDDWDDVRKSIAELTTEAHDFRTLVVDTLDWLEPLLWTHICKRDKQESVESYGYGKGYTAALDEWRVLIGDLERLRKAKGMGVVLLAHSMIRPFKNPSGEDFDRFELKLNAKAGGLLKEWSDAVLFATFETYAVKDKQNRVRGVDNNGARVVFTERRAAFDAKNRHGLPFTLPLAWADFERATVVGEPAPPADLEAQIGENAKRLGGTLEKETLASLSRSKGNATKLAAVLNWTVAKLQEVA